MSLLFSHYIVFNSLWLCRCKPDFPALHYLLGFAQPSHSLLSPSPLALSLSQHEGLFQWISSSHQMARVLELQFQHQLRVDFTYDWLVWSPCCSRNSRVFFHMTIGKASVLWCSAFFMVQLSHLYILPKILNILWLSVVYQHSLARGVSGQLLNLVVMHTCWFTYFTH